MPFIPHTPEDVQEMLQAIGVPDIASLFDEIPGDLLIEELTGIPDAMSEMEVTRLMRARAARDAGMLTFIGAGAYEHHIPAVVWDIATRGEFYSAYTPYQAEASQGTLQTIYEYQSMIVALTGLDASNASLYDGASALAEAALMAVRGNRRAKSTRVLLASGVNETYRKVAQAIAGNQGLTFDRMPLERARGVTDAAALDDDGEKNHDDRGDDEGEGPPQAHLHEADHGQGGEQGHRSLGKVENAGGLEDKHEAKRHQGIHDPLQQAGDQHLEVIAPGEEEAGIEAGDHLKQQADRQDDNRNSNQPGGEGQAPVHRRRAISD